MSALAEFGAAVVHAPPGTGKTTLAPQFVADECLRDPGQRVIVTQPRRVAARSAAARVAELRGTQLGDEVGYTVRGDSRVSKATRIEMVTPGVLLRRMLRDPDLPGVGAIIVDEVHERHIESDLVFAIAAQLRQLRDDLLVVAMSATVDAQRFANLLEVPKAVVHVPAPIFPLDIRYAPAAESITHRRSDARPGQPGSIEAYIAAGVRRALAETTEGDILAFVPTIRGTELLAQQFDGPELRAYALHGQLSPKQQSEIVNPRQAGRGGAAGVEKSGDGTRRVIFATDVAESSITVPGVRAVVDTCLSRVSRRDSSRGMSVLVTESAAQASCVQRAGRAGREGPGTVFRLISADEWARLPEFAAPAIQTSDLTGALLDVAAWGAPMGEGLALPDPFPANNAAAAEKTLRRLGAIDAEGQVTELGELLVTLPLDPRHARGGLLASRRVPVELVARVLHFLDASSTTSAPAKAVREISAKDPAVRRLVHLLKPHAPRTLENPLTGEDAIAYTIACARPELLAHRVAPGSERVLTVGGTGTVIPKGMPSVQVPHGEEWLAVADIGRSASASARKSGTGSIIRSAMPISEELALSAAGGVQKERTVTYAPDKKRVQARETTAVGAIELSSAPARASEEEAQEAVSAAIAQAGPEELEGMLQLSRRGEELVKRMQYLHDAAAAGFDGASGYPDLRAGLPEELLSFVAADIAAGRRPDVTSLLRGLIPWDQPIDELAPESLELPSGRTRRLTYPEVRIGAGGGAGKAAGGGEAGDAGDAGGDDKAAAGGDAGDSTGAVAGGGENAAGEDSAGAAEAGSAGVAAASAQDFEPVVLATKLQDVFGLTESPKIAGRRVQFHLLSPAQRPVAVTDDLASFWAGPYQGVRKDMRGRYPKHAWPEDPTAL